MKLTKAYQIARFKALEDEGPGKFEAVVSVFGNVDHQGDRVMPGAFKNTIMKWQKKGDPIPVIWSHDWLNPDAHIGFVDPADALELIDEDSKAAGGVPTGGLLVRGSIDVHKPFAAQVFDLLKDRRVKEWSFAYDVNDERTANDGANELLDLDLIEVGPCLKGANPDTYTVSAKAVLENELKEAYELQRHVARMATWEDADPEVLAMLSKSYGIRKHERPQPKLFHVERRIPSYEGPYSLEAPDTFVCIDDEKSEVVDSHKSYEAASDHVAKLKKDEHLTDAEIAAAVAEEDGEKAEGKPWHIEERDGKFCVIKDSDDSVEGCHDTREEALAQLRALYASEAASGGPDGSASAEVESEVAVPTTNDSEKTEKYMGVAPPEGSVEERQESIRRAVQEWASSAYPMDDEDYDAWSYVVATFDDRVVVCVEAGSESKVIELDYQLTDDEVVLSNPREVEIETRVVEKAREEKKALEEALYFVTSATTGNASAAFPVSVTTADGQFTWSIDAGEKIGRRIGAKAAAALKARLAEAVDEFVKDINGQNDEEEKTTEPDGKDELEEINSKLDELLGEEK